MMTNDIQMLTENHRVKLQDSFVPHTPALEDKGIRQHMFFFASVFPVSTHSEKKKTMHEVDNKLWLTVLWRKWSNTVMPDKLSEETDINWWTAATAHLQSLLIQQSHHSHTFHFHMCLNSIWIFCSVSTHFVMFRLCRFRFVAVVQLKYHTRGVLKWRNR